VRPLVRGRNTRRGMFASITSDRHRGHGSTAFEGPGFNAVGISDAKSPSAPLDQFCQSIAAGSTASIAL